MDGTESRYAHIMVDYDVRAPDDISANTIREEADTSDDKT